MVERFELRERIATALTRSRVVLLTGARQVGKTTMARMFVSPDSANYFDLENPADLARLEAPMTALEPLTGTIVIDEVQRRPDLFPVLRVLCDREPLPSRFLILGSAAPPALRQASESLTGRIEVLDLGGFNLSEVGVNASDKLWLRGGYPLSFTASNDDDSMEWRRQYIRNLANRELPEFGLRLGAATLERFLSIVANYHGQLWNSAAPARAIGISEATCRRYIDALADALIVRVLRPWSNNLGKRLVKSPKVYFRDSGLLHALIGANDQASLWRHNSMGSSWEGFVINEAIAATGNQANPFFWRTSNGAELDLLLEMEGRRVGVEVKHTDAPKVTRSMRLAMDELDLDFLFVAYPGTKRYRLAEGIEAMAIGEMTEELGAS
jgi:predicted AAA+ superfamily ATPase